MEMDSVNISLVRVNDSLVFDSVYTALKNGAKFKDFANKDNPSAKTHASDSTWIQMSTPNIAAMLGGDSIVSKIKNSQAGTIIPFQGQIGTETANIIYIVNKTTPAVKVSEIAEISYESEPSQATITKLTGDLTKFLEKNNTADAFIKNAAAAGYQVRSTRIDATTSLLENMIPESRNVIKWAMDANKGEVSGQFSDGWGESFEQRAIQVSGGEIYVHFWDTEEYYINTDEEMEQMLEENLNQGMQGIQGM